MDAFVVHFILKRHWHAEMRAGRKDIEYRAITPYWTARLTRRPVTHAAFSLGYTARGRFIRPVTQIDIGPCPYLGWTGDFYRVHLGPIMHNANEPGYLVNPDRHAVQVVASARRDQYIADNIGRTHIIKRPQKGVC